VAFLLVLLSHTPVCVYPSSLSFLFPSPSPSFRIGVEETVGKFDGIPGDLITTITKLNESNPWPSARKLASYKKQFTNEESLTHYSSTVKIGGETAVESPLGVPGGWGSLVHANQKDKIQT